MFNRYSIIRKPARLTNAAADWLPQYNAHPTEKLPVLGASASVVNFFYWGRLAKWSNNRPMSPKLHNVASGSVFSKASTKNAIRNKRCLVLADGYFLWQKVGRKLQTPYYYHLRDKALFGIAAIWETSEEPGGKEARCFLCLTDVKETEEHPVVLPEKGFEKWLRGDLADDEVKSLIQESKDIHFDFYPVSSAISKPQNNHPELVQPQNKMDQHGNYTLF